MMKETPLVSVVIPTYNSSHTLKLCLESIKSQTYTNTEIIVVDNHSTDRTLEIAESFNARTFLCKSNLSSARNFGLAHAKGKYVLNMDSDMELTERVIEECVEKCEKYNCIAISIPELTVGSSFWSKSIALEKLLNSRDQSIITPRFFKKETLFSIGGSDVELDAGEDWDLWIKLKKRNSKMDFVNSPLKHHEFLSMNSYIIKKYNWAKTVYKYLAKHPFYALKQWSPIRLSNLLQNRELIASSFQYLLGILILKAIKLLIGALGILASRLDVASFARKKLFPRKSETGSHLELQKTSYDQEYANLNEYQLENWRIEYLRRLFKALKIKRDDVFVDIGVGASGYTVIEVAKNGAEAIGVDLSSKGMKIAQRFAKEQLNERSYLCSFIVCSATYLPLRTRSASKVASIALLEHIPNDGQVLGEISRITDKNGEIFITVPNAYERIPPLFVLPYKIHDKRVGHLRHYKAEDLSERFRKRGFVLEDVFYHASVFKVIQFMLTAAFPQLKGVNSRIWWKLEEMDYKFQRIPSGLHLSMHFKKSYEPICNNL